MKLQDRQNGPSGLPENTGWLRAWDVIYNQISPTCSSSASSGMEAIVHVSSKFVASEPLITMSWSSHSWSSSSLVVSFSSAPLSSPSEITSPPWARPSVRSHFSSKIVTADQWPSLYRVSIMLYWVHVVLNTSQAPKLLIYLVCHQW